MVEPRKIAWVKSSRAWFDNYFQKFPWPNINPSYITLLSVIPAFFAAWVFPNYFLVALWTGILLLMDLADGAIAKKYKRTSYFGYLVDLYFDRITEFIVLIPFIFFQPFHVWTLLLLINYILSIISVKKKIHMVIPLRQAYALWALAMFFLA